MAGILKPSILNDTSWDAYAGKLRQMIATFISQYRHCDISDGTGGEARLLHFSVACHCLSVGVGGADAISFVQATNLVYDREYAGDIGFDIYIAKLFGNLWGDFNCIVAATVISSCAYVLLLLCPESHDAGDIPSLRHCSGQQRWL